MANLTYTADIKADVLNRCGELTNGTSKYDSLVLDYINRVHMELVVGGSTFVPELAEPWPWARAATPGLIVLLPTFDGSDGGGVNLTQGSANGAFVNAPAASLESFVGRFLWVNGYSDIYRILAHSPGSANFTLDMAWHDVSIVAGGFRAAKLDYTLASGIARLVEPFRIFRLQYFGSDAMGKVEGISSDQLHRRFPLYLFGLMPFAAPTHFAVISESNNQHTVRFNMAPPLATRTEYEYIPVPEDLTISTTPSTDPLPLVPREHRSVLSLGACYWLMVDKEDTRADTYLTLTQRKIQGMLLERRREFDDQSQDFAKLNPRQDGIWRPIPRGVNGLWYP